MFPFNNNYNVHVIIIPHTSVFFSSDCDPPLTEWEFFPQMGPRPAKSFVGLKNAGATCYMNAVIQQVYLHPFYMYESRSALIQIEPRLKLDCAFTRGYLHVSYLHMVT